MKTPSWDQNVKLAHPLERWHVYQGQSNNCGPTCVSIVGNALRDEGVVEAQSLAAEMDRRGFPDRIPGWATFPWALAGEFRRLGLQSRWRIALAEARLLQNLHTGIATVVILGEPLRFKGKRWQGWSHYKVLYAWDPQKGWAFVDPGSQKPGGVEWQKADSFRQQWTGMGRQVVEVWRDAHASVLS